MGYSRSSLFTPSEVALLAWFDQERKRIATTIQVLKQAEAALRIAVQRPGVPTQRHAVSTPNDWFLRAKGLVHVAAQEKLRVTIPHAHFGGLVKAPAGPPHHDTGVIRIPLDAYVLPTKTVRALGGAQVLDDLVEKTTGRRPAVLKAMPAPRGLLGHVPGYEDGGELSPASDSTTSPDWTTPYLSPPPDTMGGFPNNMGVYPQDGSPSSGDSSSDPSATTSPDWTTPYLSPPPDTMGGFPNYMGVYSQDGSPSNGDSSSDPSATTSPDWTTFYLSPPPDTMGGFLNNMGMYPQDFGATPDSSASNYSIMDLAHDTGRSLVDNVANIADIPAFLSGSTQGSDLGNWLRNQEPPESPTAQYLNQKTASQSDTSWYDKVINGVLPYIEHPIEKGIPALVGFAPAYFVGGLLGAGAEAAALLGLGSDATTAARFVNAITNNGLSAIANGAGAAKRTNDINSGVSAAMQSAVVGVPFTLGPVILAATSNLTPTAGVTAALCWKVTQKCLPALCCRTPVQIIYP